MTSLQIKFADHPVARPHILLMRALGLDD